MIFYPSARTAAQSVTQTFPEVPKEIYTRPEGGLATLPAVPKEIYQRPESPAKAGDMSYNNYSTVIKGTGQPVTQPAGTTHPAEHALNFEKALHRAALAQMTPEQQVSYSAIRHRVANNSAAFAAELNAYRRGTPDITSAAFQAKLKELSDKYFGNTHIPTV